jgi:hypothetical protein
MKVEENNKKLEGTINRAPRANNTREKTAVRKPWAPPSVLDSPPAPDGFKHRWISAERTAYYTQRNNDQISAVDHDMMRENAHSTMTISKPERQQRVTFGGPRKN